MLTYFNNQVPSKFENMNILNEAYLKCVSDNERNLHFWEDYVNNLKSLDFSVYSDKLTVPALVPIGNRIFFRGELKHTNEVTVALGADYFTKCSLKQAEILRQHRLKDAQSKLDVYRKEKEYLKQQLSFSKENVYENLGQEIVEGFSEEEDKVWREKHRENIRQYKLQSKAEAETAAPEVTDEELWNRLEELELQEELENELSNMLDTEPNTQKSFANTFIVKEPKLPIKKTDKEKDISKNGSQEIKPPPQTPKLDLLQQVLEKQHELEQKLQDLKYKERSQTRTEQELIDRLDEMDELEELEDEMDRLEVILETEDIGTTDEEDSISRQSSTKRGVTFADEDDSETLEIVFKHSAVLSCHEPYNKDRGITKPSDIYEVFADLFTETTSILKKTKYESSKGKDYLKTSEKNKLKNDGIVFESNDDVINKTIVVKDVIEKTNVNENKLEINARPTSLFKKKRLQKK